MPGFSHFHFHSRWGYLLLGLLLPLVFGIANAQTDSDTTSSETPNQEVIEKDVGIRQGDSINDLKISVTQYVGECPGEDWNRPEVDFVSPTEPAEDRRVRIYNRSVVVGEQSAYTDREYEHSNNNPYISNPGAEPFKIARLDEHSDRALALLKGKNQMVAIVYDGGRDNFPNGSDYKEIDVYKFTVNLTINSIKKERDLVTTSPSIECEDEYTSLDSCSDDNKVKVRYQYCPNSSSSSRQRQIIRYLDDCDD